MNPLIIFLALLINHADPGKGKLIIVVNGITSETGTLIIGLFDNADEFTVTPVMSIIEPVNKKGSMTVEFLQVPFKKYAVSIYHDLNNNQTLEKNAFGMPMEPYGFSNNPQVIMGPSFEKSLFEFNQAEMKINITLR